MTLLANHNATPLVLAYTISRAGMWRAIVALVLLATALAVTLTTYGILKDEQEESFATAVSFVSSLSSRVR